VLIGAEILAQSDVAHLKMAEEIARFHHEHWDGGGYPFGLAYSAIPIAARITALADVFDAMTHPRPYKGESSTDDALAAIAALRGKQFDPELADLFRAMVLRLQREVGDLDVYLGQAACESPFIRVRRKMASTLKGSATTVRSDALSQRHPLSVRVPKGTPRARAHRARWSHRRRLNLPVARLRAAKRARVNAVALNRRKALR